MPNITVPLWAHQQQMLDFTLSRLSGRDSYAWWIAGCATGKTLASFAVMQAVNARRTLVLTKKTIIDQVWRPGTYTEGFNILPLTKGNSVDKAKLIAEWWNKPSLVVVANYETAVRLPLSSMPFDLVVADESHKLKTHNSKQSQTLAMACQHIPMKVLGTGTAWDDRPTDAYGQVRFLDPYRKGSSVASRILGVWTNFFDEYVVYRTIDNIKIPIRYKHLDDLRRIVSPFSIYMNTDDVLDLPPEMDIDWELDWTPELKRVYRDMEVDMLAEYRDGTLVADNALSQALRLHQLTGGYFKSDVGGEFIDTPKIDAVLDIMDEIGGRPTVVFTTFETDVLALKPRLEAAGYKVKLLVGGTYEHEAFQHGDGDIILVNLAAGNAGIELTRARYAIYYSVGTSRTNYTQSRARVRRPGSDLSKPITYYHLVMPGSVDVDLHKAMVAKGSVSDYLLAGVANRVR